MDTVDEAAGGGTGLGDVTDQVTEEVQGAVGTIETTVGEAAEGAAEAADETDPKLVLAPIDQDQQVLYFK